MTLWGTDTVRDVAESVGILNLNKDVTSALCRDVEYRLSTVLEQAIKFMRHSQRTILWTSDISHALKVLDVEPLYGYESTRPLRYGEASIGPGQPLFYVEDEEMDFEKLINAPLPKVPREMGFTAHWLALEGVQPTIPQNPTTTPSQNDALHPRPPLGNPSLLAMSNPDSTTTATRPQVKHILSKELQLYFEKVCTSILDASQPEYRTAGLASLREDPGLSQLVPYFVQFVSEKVTHGLKDLFVLGQTMHMLEALSNNTKLNLSPYIASLVPPVLTCLMGRNLGPSATRNSSNGNNNGNTSASNLDNHSSIIANTNGETNNPTTSLHDHFSLRDLSASLLHHLVSKYAHVSTSLKPRLARSCLKTFLDPRKSLGSHYGAIKGLIAIDQSSSSSSDGVNKISASTGGTVGGGEIVRSLIAPNLKPYGDEVLGPALRGQEGEVKREEAERVMGVVALALRSLLDDSSDGLGKRKTDDEMTDGQGEEDVNVNVSVLGEELVEKLGSVVGGRVVEGLPGNVAFVRDLLASMS